MPMSTALRLCPQAIVRPVRFGVYRGLSEQVFDVCREFSDRLHIVGCDEAYLDLSGLERWATTHAHTHPLPDDAYTKAPAGARPNASAPVDWPAYIACALRHAVRERTRLSCSVGVAPNRFLAKIASDHRKPGGVTVVHPDSAHDFVASLPLRALRGVGPKTEAHLRARGFSTGADLVSLSREDVERDLGEFGVHLWDSAHGAPPASAPRAGFGFGEGLSRDRKSISHERTFDADVSDLATLRAALNELTGKTAYKLRTLGLSAACVTTKLRFADFSTLQRDRTLSVGPSAIDRSHSDLDFFPVADALLRELLRTRAEESRLELGDTPPVRLIGVKLSRLGDAGGRQLRLGEEPEVQRHEHLLKAADAVRQKLGYGALRTGASLGGERKKK
ncbi:MAG: DNA polymerase IV [Phycisphaerales bacterium]